MGSDYTFPLRAIYGKDVFVHTVRSNKLDGKRAQDFSSCAAIRVIVWRDTHALGAKLAEVPRQIRDSTPRCHHRDDVRGITVVLISWRSRNWIPLP
jgi:hypothetical protein